MAKKYKFNTGGSKGGKGYTPTKDQTDLISSTNALARSGADISQFTPEQIASYEAMGGDWQTYSTGGGGCGDSIGDAFGDAWDWVKDTATDIGQTFAPIVAPISLLDEGVRDQAGQNIQNISDAGEVVGEAGRDINQAAIDAGQFIDENAGDALELASIYATGGASLADKNVREQAEQSLNQVGENLADIDPLEILGAASGGLLAGGLMGDVLTDDYEDMQDAEGRRLAGEAQADADLEESIDQETDETIGQVDDEAKRRRDFLRGLNPTGKQGVGGGKGRRRFLIGI